ncbi:MAG: hypothetical protein UT02_C0007G0021 [Parcubacteria group bacterium GW2011_GWC2_38_7]|nr:MAG: hypothetical protein UT02_C0007G0021 [Parcubacteria group bacterium GW2011_GWC2_38_7]
MSIGRFFAILGVATGLCWLAWLAVLFFMSPTENSFVSLILFYASLSLAFLGTFSFIGYLIRGLTNQAELPYKHVKTATRQAILFSLLIILALILQSYSYLTWWNLLILIALLGFVELFFISYKKYNK